MSTNKNHEEHVPMVSTGNALVSTAIVEKPIRIMKQGERASWSNRIVYLLSIIGFVVDLGKYLQLKH